MAKKREVLAGKVAEFDDGGKKILENGSSEIGVYFVKGSWYAYQNMCPHQGGPACEGLMMAKVEQILADDKTHQGLRFNHDEMHIVCPWHGWEFNLADGQMCADDNFKLRKYEVDIRGEDVYVLT